MTESDELIALGQELGPSLRVALRNAADTIREPPLEVPWRSVRGVSPRKDHDIDVVVIDLNSVHHENDASHGGRRLNRGRVVTAAAAALVVLVLGIVVAQAVGHDVRTEIPSDSGPPVTIDTSPYRDQQYVLKPTGEPLGAPLVVGADAASTLLGSWGQIHEGYVFVYGDGRLIWYPDEGLKPPVVGAAVEQVVLERRLNERGLALVRGGQIGLPEFVHMLRTALSWYDIWADVAIKHYEPEHYAICPTAPGERDAPVLIDRLPAPAQTMLRGRQRTYEPAIGTTKWLQPDGTTREAPPPMECFEVTNEESSTLYRTFEAEGLTDRDHPFPQGWATTIEKDSQEGLRATPIYPHGQPVVFGE